MISVIVPIYNAEKYLDKCLTSIINQTYSDLEIILVNDGSTDESLAICEKYKQADDRIVIINKHNEGLVRARKDGIRMAKGKYITFVDADDWIDITTYEKVYTGTADIIAYGLMEEYVHCSKSKINKIEQGIYNKKEIQSKIIPRMLSTEIFFEFGLLPNLCCKLIKKSLLLETIDGVSDNITIGEDVDFFFRIVYKAESLLIKTDTPYHYRQHPESMMRTGLSEGRMKALYWDLYNIKEAVGSLEWVAQLNRYITFVMLLKRPDKVIRLIDEMKGLKGKVVIYGAGAFGKGIYNELKQNMKVKEIVMVDKQWEYLSQEQIIIENPKRIVNMNPDKVIITILNENICNYAKEYLIGLGVGIDTIITINFADICDKRVFDMQYEGEPKCLTKK